MCGRYSLYKEKEVHQSFGVKITPNYNISPNSKVLILEEKLIPKYINWGIKTYWLKNKSIINARIESLREKRFFDLYKKCIFVANGYIEWKKIDNTKLAYYHYGKESLIFFAGIYNEDSACIVTTKSQKKLKLIHNRQPVILQNYQFKDWLKKSFLLSEMISNINYYQINNKINNPLNNKKSLLDKI